MNEYPLPYFKKFPLPTSHIPLIDRVLKPPLPSIINKLMNKGIPN